MLLDSDIFIANIKEEDGLKQPSMKILKAVEKRKLKTLMLQLPAFRK